MVQYCFDLSGVTLHTDVMKKICKYHKRKGQYFASTDIIKDFCPDAFYVTYPVCLSLLYDARFSPSKWDPILKSCPNPGGIEMQVKRVKKWNWYTFGVIRSAQKLFDLFLFPLEVELYDIEITVISNRGECPAGYKGGEKYLLSIL